MDEGQETTGRTSCVSPYPALDFEWWTKGLRSSLSRSTVGSHRARRVWRGGSLLALESFGVRRFGVSTMLIAEPQLCDVGVVLEYTDWA
jgi:hypothetical protein